MTPMMRNSVARPLALALAASLAVAACAAEDSEPPTEMVGPAPDLTETALKVPGFADFLAVDGDTVWVTNDGTGRAMVACRQACQHAGAPPLRHDGNCGRIAVGRQLRGR